MLVLHRRLKRQAPNTESRALSRALRSEHRDDPGTARYYTCPGGQCQDSPRSVAEWEGKCNAPDVWESSRFTSLFLASGCSYISNIVHARPPVPCRVHAGHNARRWATV
jgi:hypothetical protein